MVSGEIIDVADRISELLLDVGHLCPLTNKLAIYFRLFALSKLFNLHINIKLKH